MTPIHDRPRERILVYGADGASAADLLAVVLGTGTRNVSAEALAQRLLDHVGGVGRLARAPARELVAVAGIGEARAVRVVAAFELGRRGLASARAGDAVREAEDVYQRLRPRLAGLTQEVFVVVALDIRNQVIAELEVARGCLTGVEVHPREVFRPLVRLGAAACVVAHNHPSGDPTPSREDILLTEQLRAVGELIGIPLLDHVVVGADGFRSLFELVA